MTTRYNRLYRVQENCFELTFEGMDLKFTSLQERNIYNESQIRDWCRDGDLETFVTGEFDIITIMGELSFLNPDH